MLQEGNKAPAFSLPASTGENLSLNALAGKKVVLYFYPRDNTHGCTTEALAFRDAAARLHELGAVVLGVSKDSVASHCKFIEKHSLNFVLLSDPDGAVIEKYGAWGKKNNYGRKLMGIVRTTVVIDGKGVVRKIFGNVRLAGHVDHVLDALGVI